ncbi:hypothetical protein [Myroides odoratus]|uniref:hypothetical protein n=1 Tax=Myroides odoratus TaxID=256 RepID=UPI00333E8BE7
MKLVFTLCFIIYCIFKMIAFYFKGISLSDILSIFSIVVDILIPICIAYFLQNRFLKNRDSKHYYIKQIETLILEYDLFLKSIKRGKLNRSEISNEFQNFSINFLFIDNQIQEKFKIKYKVQPINRQLQRYVTNTFEYNNTITSAKVKLRGSSTTEINRSYTLVLEYGSNVISKLQK